MSNRFETTHLWQSTLAAQLDPDPEARLRGELRVAFDAFRTRAAHLAAEIARDLPDFTIHDITHIDALWEMADIIAGPDFALTPTEAFVLGGAFLTHDLGMSAAAVGGGGKKLQDEMIYRDTVTALLRNRLGRTPTTAETATADEGVRKAAIAATLRTLHAHHAERLALATWKDDRGNEFHLIEDPELRRTYGRIIGVIAHSHWWGIDRVATDLPSPLGAPGGYPNSWTVDPLKLACLLRAADAAHLDSRRASAFVRALRNPSNDAVPHWDFQQKLYQPRLQSGRLVFTSKEPFPVEEAQAWWTCFDALQMVDRELRDVDVLLADSRRTRLAATGVVYAEEPKRLAKLIPTEGWQPVDTRVRVTAVASLVSTLGGAALYGKNSIAPLRELIQNGCDAVRARRLLEHLDPSWGKVSVRLGEDTDGYWLEVEDIGVGMSPRVLSGSLLDFGNSFWGSTQMHQELPGLDAAGFSATGRFGIGFFSVFMLGGHVTVCSRRFEAAREDTWVLQFEKGLAERPLLRKARPDEFIREGGTRIRVNLPDVHVLRNVSQMLRTADTSLGVVLSTTCPALDVDLLLQESTSAPEQLIRASDWVSMPALQLLYRIEPELAKEEFTERAAVYASLLEILRDSTGAPIGRVCIDPWVGDHSRSVSPGVVTVGGFASSRLFGLAGILIGATDRAARDVGIPFVDGTQLASFASRQATMLNEVEFGDDQSEILRECASTVRMLGGDTGPLPIAYSRGGYMSFTDVVRWARGLRTTEVVIVQDAAESLERRRGPFELLPNVLVTDVGQRQFLSGDSPWTIIDWPVSDAELPLGFHAHTAAGSCIEALAEGWDVNILELLARSERSTDEISVAAEIGEREGKPVTKDHVDIIRHSNCA